MKKIFSIMLILIVLYSSCYAVEYYSSFGASPRTDGQWFLSILTVTPSMKTNIEVTKIYSKQYSGAGWTILVAENTKSSDYVSKDYTYKDLFRSVLQNKVISNPYLSYVDVNGYQTRVNYNGVEKQSCIEMLTNDQQTLAKDGIKARLIY
jgi:hypothetical protein